METQEKINILVQVVIKAPIEKVWKCWTSPDDIIHWNNASDDWHTPYVENDLKVGGRFLSKMEAKDGSFSFDFAGTYIDIKTLRKIAYKIDDGRKVTIYFSDEDGKTTIREKFEAETSNSIELQQNGWQAILNNFKKYVELK